MNPEPKPSAMQKFLLVSWHTVQGPEVKSCFDFVKRYLSMRRKAEALLSSLLVDQHKHISRSATRHAIIPRSPREVVESGLQQDEDSNLV